MRPIDADELIHTTEFAIIASMLTTDKVKKEILKELQKFLKERVDDAPTIEAEPIRHGKWVAKEYNDKLYIPCCSECDVFVTLSPYELNYCPNCGARMDGGKII